MELVRNEKFKLSSNTPDELGVARGRPGVYRLKEIDGIFNLDCGFYTPKNMDVYAVAEKGKYLNQEIIDKGFAARYWK